MAATRASWEDSETEIVLTKIYEKKEAGGVRGGGSPAGWVIHPSLSKLQHVILLWSYGVVSLSRQI